MEQKQSKLSILTRPLIAENPSLVLLLGTCPTLATTTSVINGMRWDHHLCAGLL